MIKETMKPLERILAAVNFEKVDRTPVVIAPSNPFLGNIRI
jgi:hypothetical protein